MIVVTASTAITCSRLVVAIRTPRFCHRYEIARESVRIRAWRPVGMNVLGTEWRAFRFLVCFELVTSVACFVVEQRDVRRVLELREMPLR